MVTSSSKKVRGLCKLAETIFDHHAHGQKEQWHGLGADGQVKEGPNNKQVRRNTLKSAKGGGQGVLGEQVQGQCRRKDNV